MLTLIYSRPRIGGDGGGGGGGGGSVFVCVYVYVISGRNDTYLAYA